MMRYATNVLEIGLAALALYGYRRFWIALTIAQTRALARVGRCDVCGMHESDRDHDSLPHMFESVDVATTIREELRRQKA